MYYGMKSVLFTCVKVHCIIWTKLNTKLNEYVVMGCLLDTWLRAVYWIRGYGLFTGYVVRGCLLGTWLRAVYWVRG